MTWLYRVTPTRLAMLTEGPTPTEQEAVGRHFAYLQGLCADGVVHLAGRTLNNDADTFGLVIFSAEGEEAARLLMERDPAVQAGVMQARLFPCALAILDPLALAAAAGRA